MVDEAGSVNAARSPRPIRWRWGLVFRSLLPREGQRLDLALIRAALLASLIPVLWITQSNLARGIVSGHNELIVPSTWSSLLLAAYLAGDFVGMRGDGTFALLRLTGIAAWEWWLVCWLRMLANYCSVWIVRLPVLCLLITCGGISWTWLLQWELFYLLLFWIVGSLGLLLSLTAETRQNVTQGVWSFLVLIEIFWGLPLVVLMTLQGLSVWSPAGTLLKLAEGMAGCGTGLRLIEKGTMVAPQSIGTYVLIALWCSWSYCRNLFQYLDLTGTETGVAGSSVSSQWGTSRTTRRSSRRSWDDALAWQSVAVHGQALELFSLRIALWLLAWMTLPLLAYAGYTPAALTAACGAVVVGLAQLMMKPADCLAREFKEETLGSLMMAGFDATDLYNGWRRGIWRLGWIDLLSWGALFAVFFRIGPAGPPVVLAVGMLLISAGPMLMMLNAVPWSLAGIMAALSVIAAVVLTIVLCVNLALWWNPWLLPAVVAPLWWLGNEWVRLYWLPRWVHWKLNQDLDRKK
jgi:hypothetical protein